MNNFLSLSIFILLLSSIAFNEPLNAQHCTSLGIEYYEIFNYKKLDKNTIQIMDNLLISFYKNLPNRFERNEKLYNDFEKQVFQHLPDSIQQSIPLSQFIFSLAMLQDLYTIESNGYSIAYNQFVENFISEYHIEGMSLKGMENFVYQFPDHKFSLFLLENAASPNRVSPIFLKQRILEEYDQFLSDSDLDILASGWDKRIATFIEDARKRDSAYAVSLQNLVPRIDSLKNLYYPQLSEISANEINKLTQEEIDNWTEMAQKYLNTIDSVKSKEIRQMREYYGDYLQNVIQYHEYFYELKKIFPSSNFWAWRKGPKIKLSTTQLESNSEYLYQYIHFEDELVKIINKYAANSAYPNYYFSGSQTYSADKIKSIQISNAILFAAIHK